MARCVQCNKELPKDWHTDICMECSEENVRKIFKEHPEVKQCFKETLDELRQPENVEMMAKNLTKVIGAVDKITKHSNYKNRQK